MGRKTTSEGVARVAEKSAAMKATMGECELAEAFRDEAGEANFSDPKMTRVNMSQGFGCTYY